MPKSLNIIYAGTPEFAVHALNAVHQSRHKICCVYTQPDRPSGRGQKIKFSPVKQFALDASLEIRQPKSLRGGAYKEIENHQADLMLVCAYGLMLPENVLRAPDKGCINIHASLLPRWRGAAPIQRAILGGDSLTGITMMQMVEELDAGPILYQSSCEINSCDTAQQLHDRLAALSAREINKVLELLTEDKLRPTEQDLTKVTYAEKLIKQEADINWNETAIIIDRKIRAFNSWPVAYTYLDEKRLRVWQARLSQASTCGIPGKILKINQDSFEVATAEGVIEIISIQEAGGKKINARDFCNANDILHKVLGSAEEKLAV